MGEILGAVNGLFSLNYPRQWKHGDNRSQLLETVFFPAGALEQVMRAEEVLVQAPSLVRVGCQTARTDILFIDIETQSQ